MQIVIDIPEEYRNYIKRNYNFKGKDDYNAVVMAIANGIVLPKGHGRLIDADDVDNHIIGYVNLRTCPTIIEADKE